MQNKYTRECPKCHKILNYIDKRNLNRAIENKSTCVKCREITKEWRENISKGGKGLKHKNYNKINYPNKDKNGFSRNCPDCNKKLFYINELSRNNATKHKTLCNSCSGIKYEKFKYFLQKEESRNKMVATKAGFKSYEEYMNNLPEIKKYRRDVWRLTYKQPI